MKTIRLNKKVFFAMMVITPFFAAFTTAFIFMLIFSPFKTTAPLEVPTLGGVVEEATEEPVKTEVSKEEPVTETPKEEVTEVVTETKALMVTQAQSITQKPAEQPVKVETKPIEKTTEKIEKAACEARTDGPKILVEVSFLNPIDYISAILSDREDAVALYTRSKVKDGKNAKMVYQYGSCMPSEEDLVVIDFEYLDQDTLDKYHISSDYKSWY
ncbi:hypothetical protein J6X90_03515 [Candidatus Saccharibacteria bacterium]|nr:hypothetical protein [Candidatus Saccharibacteria bacterium]